MQKSFSKLIKEKQKVFSQIAQYRTQGIVWNDLDSDSKRIISIENEFNQRYNIYNTYCGCLYAGVLTWLYLLDEQSDPTSLDLNVLEDPHDKLLLEKLASAYTFANRRVNEISFWIKFIGDKENRETLKNVYPILYRAIRLTHLKDVKIKIPLFRQVIFDTQFLLFVLNDDDFINIYTNFHKDLTSAANYKSLVGMNETEIKEVSIKSKSKSRTFFFNPNKYKNELAIISAIKRLLNFSEQIPKQSEFYANLGKVSSIDSLKGIQLIAFQSLKQVCQFSSGVSAAIKVDVYYSFLQMLAFQGVALAKDIDPDEIDTKEEMIKRKRCVEKLFSVT